MEKWYHECMDLYYEYGLTEEKLEKSIERSNMNFRKDAIKFLKDMADKNWIDKNITEVICHTKEL